jgi:glycine C-acetyltransferase
MPNTEALWSKSNPMSLISHLTHEIEKLKQEGLYKTERVLSSAQSANITANHQNVLNFCANNYLGLADHSEMIQAAIEGLNRFGLGMASVRFICGTQTPHMELEQAMADFLGTESVILFSSCFDANGGLFEGLLGEEDAVISDALNHASIIDGIRLCKAQRFRYANNDMAALETQLQAAEKSRFRIVATDGVFSMDGTIANLPEICALAKKYGAMVMVDDSHAVGFMGANGRGTHEHLNVIKEVTILTGTFGKALGGASGGYIAGPKVIIEWLRQKARPYLFSNSLAPAIVLATLKALELIKQHPELRTTLHENTRYFREKMTKAGFNIVPGEHPIVPVMIHDAALATKMANALLARGIYVIGFSFPVVPKGQARIRVQLSSLHTRQALDQAIIAFTEVGKELNLI